MYLCKIVNLSSEHIVFSVNPFAIEKCLLVFPAGSVGIEWCIYSFAISKAWLSSTVLKYKVINICFVIRWHIFKMHGLGYSQFCLQQWKKRKYFTNNFISALNMKTDLIY